MKKQFLPILALALMLALLAGCGEAADPGFDAVADAVKAAVGTEDMAEQDAAYIAGMIKLESGSYEDALLMKTNVGTASDEFGLFKGKDEAQAEAIHAAIEDYLQRSLDGFLPYHPEELPKLQNAKIYTEGSYVLYTVLDEETKAAVSAAFTSCFEG